MRYVYWALPLILGLSACGHSQAPAAADPRALAWPAVEQAARGQTVTLAMWQGDPQINAYMQDYVVPRLKKNHGITLRIVPGQGNTLVSTLMTEAEAGRATSPIDLVWINGETFYQLRQIHALFGPFTDKLPNNRYVDWANPFIANDFQQPVDGMECPWGNVQLLLITDRAKVPQPPRTPDALAAWIHAHPGRFSFDTGFTGMSFLKSLLYAFADSPQQLQGPFNATVYHRLRDRVFDWVRSVRKDLWRHGDTFPSSVAQLNQLFANGEVDFTMSFNDGQVDNKIDSGLFPKTAEAFVLTSGTLQNSHYIGIVAGSEHKAAAMVVANFLISPAAQWQKLKPSVWGDGTVLDLQKLPPDWRQRFEHVPGRSHAPLRAAIRPYARPEPAPETMIHISDDFRQEILGRAGG
ncbi:MAG: ABC transporter substrate-binding protein [Gammaproteobacteria bacterium]|nr:ABC transporter substrate-binding protein [Gammaproteobacteria bacterium]